MMMMGVEVVMKVAVYIVVVVVVVMMMTIVLLAESEGMLQRNVDEFNRLCKRRKLKVNAGKVIKGAMGRM